MKPEGYRYVRAYWDRRVVHRTLPRLRWALWEVREGRARRVGTAQSEAEYLAWLKAGVPHA